MATNDRRQLSNSDILRKLTSIIVFEWDNGFLVDTTMMTHDDPQTKSCRCSVLSRESVLSFTTCAWEMHGNHAIHILARGFCSAFLLSRLQHSTGFISISLCALSDWSSQTWSSVSRQNKLCTCCKPFSWNDLTTQQQLLWCDVHSISWKKKDIVIARDLYNALYKRRERK